MGIVSLELLGPAAGSGGGPGASVFGGTTEGKLLGNAAPGPDDPSQQTIVVTAERIAADATKITVTGVQVGHDVTIYIRNVTGYLPSIPKYLIIGIVKKLLHTKGKVTYLPPSPTTAPVKADVQTITVTIQDLASQIREMSFDQVANEYRSLANKYQEKATEFYHEYIEVVDHYLHPGGH